MTNAIDDKEIQARIEAAVEAATSGLKAKNSELIGKLKTQSDSLQRFEGIDPDAVKNILQRFGSEEEAKLIAGGKIDEVLQKRTDRMKADYDKQLDAAKTVAEQAQARAQAYESRVLDDSLRAAATDVGIHKHAIDDALARGRSMFMLDADGKAVAKGKDGAPVFGKDGKTPLMPKEWLESMKEPAPHWFPSTATGGGAAPSSSMAPGAFATGSLGGTKSERTAAIAARFPDLK